MIFEQLLFQAKEGDLESITDTVLPFKFCLKTKKGTAPSFSSF